MPKALAVDWKEIETLYLQGITPQAIQRRTGVKATTIQRRAARYDWREQRDKLHQNLSRTAPSDMQARASTWQERIANLMESRLLHLETIKPDQLKLSDLETLARITELTDKQARRTFGLDQQQSPVSVGLVGITLHVQAYEPKEEPKAIDVSSTHVQEDEAK